MFAVGQALRIPNHLYLPFNPGGDLFCRHGQENHPPGETEGGGIGGRHQVGWKGGTPLPGSPNISQPVDSVFSLNNGGVYHSCEVICLLSSCTVKATRSHSYCKDKNPTLSGRWSIIRAENTVGQRAELALLPVPPQIQPRH